tara:strand:- start:8 stop:316 length:309 start_codon:yes stop_codon:yes gene_type:complete
MGKRSAAKAEAKAKAEADANAKAEAKAKEEASKPNPINLRSKQLYQDEIDKKVGDRVTFNGKTGVITRTGRGGIAKSIQVKWDGENREINYFGTDYKKICKC